MMMRVRFLSIALLLLGLSPSTLAGERLPVVATFSILGDLVQQVGGDKVAVTTLVGPDGDAHVYQPTPQDVRALAGARLLVVNGLGLEGWIDRLAQTAHYRGATVIASSGITIRQLPTASRPDPHAWQDPVRVQRYVQNIEAALVKADSPHAAYYHQRAAAYLAQLTRLQQWAEAAVSTVPAERRKVISNHDAFAYLGERYGIQFLAAQGLSTESEASARDIGQLIQQVRRLKVKAIFTENISNPKLIAQIARETGAKPGAELYSDALSKAGGDASDYLSLMRHNIAALVVGMKQN
jgi:zinc/manganese transport system substrate-binding protein